MEIYELKTDLIPAVVLCKGFCKNKKVKSVKKGLLATRKLESVSQCALKNFEKLRLVLTKRRKAYVTTIGNPAAVLSLTTV